MGDYKKIILYVILIMLAFNLWTKWEQAHPPVTGNASMQQNSTTQQRGAVTTDQSAATSNQAGNTAVTKTPTAPAANSNVSQQNLVTVKTDVMDLSINTLGGSIVELNLPKYPVALHSSQSYQLLNYDSVQHYTTAAVLNGFTDHPLQYHVAKKSYTLEKGQKQLDVVLQATTDKGVKVTKTLHFYPDAYLVGVDYHLSNQSSSTQSGNVSLQISRTDVKPARDSTFRMHTFYGFVTSTSDNHYQTHKFSKLSDQPVNQQAKNGWIAMSQHYFLSAWIPTKNMTYHYFSHAGNNGIYTLGANSQTLSIAPQKTADINAKLYIGPKITKRLEAAAPYLKKTIDYGWLWPISILIFWLMSHIFGIIGNWGWSIVIVTVIIKLIFWPLSAKSYRSMASMRSLQPKIAALKESCGDDKQKFGREMMALYKREKANPLGGCLPIVVQIPFFIALYWVLIATIQLRQAPFMLWIHNLSAADPYYVIPVLMGLTMFIQQKLSPPPPDPTQAKVMMFLPVFITVIFIKFPAGLILYMLVNNIISISQQYWITKRHEQGVYQKKDNTWAKRKKNSRKKK